MILISQPENEMAPIAEVTVNIENIEKEMRTPRSTSFGKIIVLNDKVRLPINLELLNTELVHGARVKQKGQKEPAIPEWKVYVRLDNANNVQEGDEIILNARAVFPEDGKDGWNDNDPGKKWDVNYMLAGNWLFPVIVTSNIDIETGKDFVNPNDKEHYHIAYVKVIVKWNGKEDK